MAVDDDLAVLADKGGRDRVAVGTRLRLAETEAEAHRVAVQQAVHDLLLLLGSAELEHIVDLEHSAQTGGIAVAVHLLGDHYHGLGVDLDSAELLGNTEQTEAGFQCRQLELLEGLLLSFTFLNVGFIKFALSEELVYAFQQEFLLFCFSEIHTFSFLYVQFLLPLILWQSYSPKIRNKRANCSVAVKNYFFDKFSCRSAWFFPCAS